MPVKKSLFLFWTFSALCSFSQTGPAGIGTSTNNALWLKADAGTSSTSNNTAISYWNDQSGNALNTTQTLSAQQPSFATNIMNGFPAILFDNSGSGSNDKLIGPDSPLLDNTSGYTFFLATRPQNLDGSARAIISKRTTVSVDESFMLFYYTSNKLNIDIQTTDNRFASNTTYSNSVNYITSLTYDGSVSTSTLRCTLYNEETFDKNAAETNTLVPDNSSPLLIGTTDASDSRPYGGYISEIIIYREALTLAKRIIINNYLSAKYDISLSANDKYQGDNSANGDYDRDVAGIGQESTGSNTSFSASISGGLILAANSGLDNGDYILAGHAVANNTTITTDVGGMTGSGNARWQRVWYVDITNSSTNINTNIGFDMSDGGMGTFTLGSISNYVLLYRAGQSGNWTELTTASSISGDKVFFNSITLTNDGYYTLGTKNYNLSPLPIELLSFTTVTAANHVQLIWSTASEKNNDFFTVERSKDGFHFENITRIKGAGSTTCLQNYRYTDENPFDGISYYRLAQTDYNGKTSSSNLLVVEIGKKESEVELFPNPNSGSFKIKFNHAVVNPVQLIIKDLSGKEYLSKTIVVKDDGLFSLDLQDGLNVGNYVVMIFSDNAPCYRKLIIK